MEIESMNYAHLMRLKWWHIYMGIIMRTSAALARVVTRVVLPLNQLSSSFAAGCTGLQVWMLMASLPRNMAFPPKLVVVRLLLKLPSSSLARGLNEGDIGKGWLGGVQRGLWYALRFYFYIEIITKYFNDYLFVLFYHRGLFVFMDCMQLHLV